MAGTPGPRPRPGAERPGANSRSCGTNRAATPPPCWTSLHRPHRPDDAGRGGVPRVDLRTQQVVLDVVDGPGADTPPGSFTAGLDPSAVRVERVAAALHRQAASPAVATRSATAAAAAPRGSRPPTRRATDPHRRALHPWVVDPVRLRAGSPRHWGAAVGRGGHRRRRDPGRAGQRLPTVAGDPRDRVEGGAGRRVGLPVRLEQRLLCGTVERTGRHGELRGPKQQSGLTSVAA
ncbi:hypothetical protein HBB16_18705 [Pseudonocardia sp. MCCB 268]|nr:hypothetical protein [Pseudonocardia cytotoxica]